MKRSKKIITRFALLLLLLVPVVGFAHYVVFPEETHCIMIDYQGFDKEENFYFRPNVDQQTRTRLKTLSQQASKRIKALWGEQLSTPYFIYCDNEEDFQKFAGPYATVAATLMKWGAYVPINEQGLDLDIIAHEISHAELYHRVGFWNNMSEIPMWFRQGIAMQVDLRDYYSEDTLASKSNNFQDLPDVEHMFSTPEFNGGTREQVMLNYMTAGYILRRWYSRERLLRFVEDINAGKRFGEAYKGE